MRLRAKQTDGVVTVYTATKLPPDLKKVVEEIADHEQRSLSQMIRLLIEESPKVRERTSPEAVAA